jgi:hypothetical protein
MGDRYWVSVGVRLLVAGVIVAWAVSYLGTGSGEKEFQKTLDAMKQVHSFRASEDRIPAQNMHNDKSWDVDCARDLVHYQGHLVGTGSDNPHDITEDQIAIGGRNFELQVDGSWAPMKIPRPFNLAPAKFFCASLAQGTDTNLLPPIATMIKRGVIQKGDKKTVNGVRCREWLVTMKGGRTGLEHDTVCLGLEDHLPYEMTVDWENSRSSFSGYNAPIQFDVPEAAVQPANTSRGSN